MKPYPAYKDAGVPWLDQLPIDWRIRRAKEIFQCVDIRSITGSEELLTVSSQHGVIPRRTATVTMFKAESYTGHKLCWPRDLVVNSLWAWAGGMGFARHHGIVSTAYSVYRLRPEFADYWLYFDYLLRSVTYNWEFHVRSKGVWTSRLQLTDLSFLSMPILMPDEQDAVAICKFITNFDGYIHRLIRTKRRLITLLNEQKQALIHRAVTQGIDPDAPKKSSGIDWLGDIPAHWSIRRNSSLFFERIERGDPEWPILVVSLRTGVTVGGEETVDGRPRRLIEDRSNYKKAIKGDITYNMMRMWQGALGVSPIDGLVSPAYVVAAPRADVNSQFFAHLYRTTMYKSEVNRVSTGIVSDRNRLYWDDFKNLPSPVPPIAEQCTIITILEKEHASIDYAIARAQKEIDLLRE